MSLWGFGGRLDITQGVPFFFVVVLLKGKNRIILFSNVYFNVSFFFFSAERTDFL